MRDAHTPRWPVLTLAVIMGIVLAGCTGPGPAGNETDPTDDPGGDAPPAEDETKPSHESLTIVIESTGSWTVAVPVPVADPGTSVEAWHHNLTFTGTASSSVRDTDRGKVLRITGEGDVQATSEVAQGGGHACCVDAFADAEWSARTEDGAVMAGVWSGSVILDLRFEAVSKRCHRQDHWVGQLEHEGDDLEWVALGGERRGGCGPGEGSRDRSKETLEVAIEAAGQWIVAIPLPVSSNGTSAQDWFANLTTAGTAITELGGTGEGVVLKVRGAGSDQLTSHVEQGSQSGRCCAEQYLGAQWSAGERTGDEWPERAIRIGSWDGSAAVEIDYSATSDLCGRTDTFEGSVTAETDAGGDAEATTSPDTSKPPTWVFVAGESRSICQ